MTQKYSHTNKEDFKRYLENEMTDKERHAFEKELQRHSFEAEALEGFEATSLKDFNADLEYLHEKIQTKKRRKIWPYYAAAASIFLIVSLSIVWFQFDKATPIPELSETKELPVTKESRVEQKSESKLQANEESTPASLSFEEAKREMPANSEKKQVQESRPQKSNNQINIENKSAKTVAPLKKVPQNELIQAEPEPQTATDEIALSPIKDIEIVKEEHAVTELKVSRLESENTTIYGIVISAADNEPLPGVSIVEKGTINGVITDLEGSFELELSNKGTTIVASFVGMESSEFQPTVDSAMQIALEPQDLALEEVVVVGYGTRQKSSATSSVSHISNEPYEFTKAKPKGGNKAFKKYVKGKAILPMENSESKVTVKLQVHIDKNGDFSKIEAKSQSDPELFQKAKTILLDGPEWTPAEKNGKKIDSEITIKIIFKK